MAKGKRRWPRWCYKKITSDDLPPGRYPPGKEYDGYYHLWAYNESRLLAYLKLSQKQFYNRLAQGLLKPPLCLSIVPDLIKGKEENVRARAKKLDDRIARQQSLTLLILAKQREKKCSRKRACELVGRELRLNPRTLRRMFAVQSPKKRPKVYMEWPLQVVHIGEVFPQETDKHTGEVTHPGVVRIAVKGRRA